MKIVHSLSLCVIGLGFTMTAPAPAARPTHAASPPARPLNATAITARFLTFRDIILRFPIAWPIVAPNLNLAKRR